MKVLVTGGAGFIGANLCRALLERSEFDEIVVLDDLSTGSADNLADLGLELQVGSIMDDSALTSAARDVDSIVHLAARPSVPKSLQDPVRTHEVNATGTLKVLEAARAVNAHVIVASSSSVYGDTPSLPKHEELPTRPLSPYGVSKLAAEAYASAYSVSFELRTLAFRFFNVYGPWQRAGHDYAAVVPAFVDAALDCRPLTIFGDGLQTRDFTFVGTVASILTDALLRQVTHTGAVNLAFGTRSTLIDVVSELERVLGQSVDVIHTEPRRGDIRDSQAADDLLQDLFPGVKPVALLDGLQETVRWQRDLRR